VFFDCHCWLLIYCNFDIHNGDDTPWVSLITLYLSALTLLCLKFLSFSIFLSPSLSLSLFFKERLDFENIMLSVRPTPTQHTHTGIVFGHIKFWVRWLNFTEFWTNITSCQSYHGPGVDSSPSENEYQEHLLGVKADDLTIFMRRMSWNLGN